MSLLRRTDFLPRKRSRKRGQMRPQKRDYAEISEMEKAFLSRSKCPKFNPFSYRRCERQRAISYTDADIQLALSSVSFHRCFFYPSQYVFMRGKFSLTFYPSLIHRVYTRFSIHIVFYSLWYHPCTILYHIVPSINGE